MQIDCPPTVQGSPNLTVIDRLFASWHPPDVDGTLRLEEAASGRTRLCFEGGSPSRHLWFYGLAFDTALLGDPARRRTLARLTKNFLHEATEALSSLLDKPRFGPSSDDAALLKRGEARPASSRQQEAEGTGAQNGLNGGRPLLLRDRDAQTN